VPSFLQFRATEELWTRFPGRERVEGARAALTFDDGPDPDATPAVLDALDAAGLKATFFIVGEQAAAHPRLAREVATRGHEIALHGYEHREHGELSPREARDDLARGLGAVEATTGRRATSYRPPYGRFSEDSYEACSRLRLEPVLWSAWGMDWEPLPPARIADLVVRDLDPGAIVLLHDSARYASRHDAAATAQAIPLLAAAAAERGLEFGPLAEG
jgi:peptidoglycan/xylan/chitin deacetylase (PgdA/CDA1 family)